MAQDNYNDPEKNRQIILAAFNSIDASKCANEEELTRQVTRRAVTISKMLADNSIENRALSSVRLYVEVHSVELEESSQRYVIKFKAVRGDGDDIESIRTARMDSYDGRIIKPMIDKLITAVKNAEGSDRKARAVLYKYNEPAPEGAKGPKVPSHGYRNVCWLEVF